MYLGSNLFVGHIYGQRAVYCLIYIKMDLQSKCNSS